MSTTIMIHTLKNYAPSSLNRGQDGAPKSATFAGSWRGRISSQAIKRSIRQSSLFSEFAEQGLIGIRTRELPALVGAELSREGWDPMDVEAVIKKFSEIGKKEGKADKEPGKTNQMLMIPAGAPAAIAEQVKTLYNTDGWKSIEESIRPLSMRSVDVALFGAMATTALFPDVNAACQVANAMSVNRTQKAVDFFVAVDDLTGDSRMIGESLFNSNCYYHSIAVNWQQLMRNLDQTETLARAALGKLIEAVATVSPGGKQNTFASHPLADLVLVEVTTGQYFDYANAFAKAIEATDEAPIPLLAAKELKAYTDKTDKLYNRSIKRHHITTFADALWPMAHESLADMMDAVSAEIHHV